MTGSESTVRADRADSERAIASLAPLAGGIWLATDLTTFVHWTIRAGHVARVTSTLDGRVCRASGLLTVRDPDFLPVFLINEGDTLDWIEPGQILAVRELGQESCEIRLERLDDLDARTICSAGLSSQAGDHTRIRTIQVSADRHLQIYDEQLQTGDVTVDATLQTIETTIDARQRLIGPAAGTLDVLAQMAHDLDQTLRTNSINSYVWPAILRERITRMRSQLAA